MKKNLSVVLFIVLLIVGCKSSEERQEEENRENALNILSDALDKVKDFKLLDCYKYYDSTKFYSLLNDRVEQAVCYAKDFSSLVERKLDSHMVVKSYVDSMEKIAKLEQFDSLKKRFTLEKSEFKPSNLYFHKQWGNDSVRARDLMACVGSNGKVYLMSNYYLIFTDNVVDHQFVIVDIDTIRYRSPLYDKNKRELVNYRFKRNEINFYEHDRGIIEAIAKNVEKNVHVIFSGKEYYDEINISESDKLAIKDCYRLGKLIRECR